MSAPMGLFVWDTGLQNSHGNRAISVRATALSSVVYGPVTTAYIGRRQHRYNKNKLLFTKKYCNNIPDIQFC